MESSRDLMPQSDLRNAAKHADFEPAGLAGAAVDIDEDLDVVAAATAKDSADDLERQRFLACGVTSNPRHVGSI